MKYFYISAIFLLSSCSSVAFNDSFVIETDYNLKNEDEIKIVYKENPECKKAIKVLKYRNTRIEERFDECSRNNKEVECLRWVYGYAE